MLRGSTVLRETQLVQYALGVTSVQMVHLQRFVQLDNLHPLALRLVRHVLLVIDAQCSHVSWILAKISKFFGQLLWC